VRDHSAFGRNGGVAMTSAAMQRARTIVTAARAEVAKLGTQDPAIPWTLHDLDQIVDDLTNQIEAEEAHPELPIYVDFPMEAGHA